ncbi:putative serine/threonine-protein kinase, active [Septoria linicola]|nr:putative serine/threonine-protein kinase, active [Septoria linicola]
MSSQPPGTFLPNTKVTVGSHKVYIEKYLSEGGFAHVYVVRVPRDNNKHEIAVLKRVAVPDKEHLANMRTEVETMKKLKGHKHIVTYFDSHASQLPGGGYEVFLLMEYCKGGGLIDFMNTRLQHRLTEPEILKIFGDCAEGLACMHYLKPPLLHRDLKVENVLISKSAAGTPIYKLCDFGSTAPPRPAAKTAEEGRLIEEDVQKHTTMQYRSPEMIDVWRKQPIDEKADIWALGVLLYKLCYYTTPFEAVGQMAILNASFKFPPHPQFSERLRKLISAMLKEDPKNRPNIYQVLKETCSMRGVPVPIQDIYTNRTQSEVRRNETLPSDDAVSNAAVGLQKVAPQVQVQQLPDITPMRRGRPTAPAQQGPTAAKQSTASTTAPAKGDPFAALDSKNYDVRSGAVDELAKRFPSLDEFAITHDGSKFPFAAKSPPAIASTPPTNNSLSGRVTNALADEVFATKTQEQQKPQSARPATSASAPRRTSPVRTSTPSTTANLRSPPTIQHPAPMRNVSPYKSTAVGTSPPPSTMRKMPDVSKRPIWRVPEHTRTASQPRASEDAQAVASSLKPSLPPAQRPALLEVHRSKSQTATVQAEQAQSSRPSLEGHRPSSQDLGQANDISRTKSLSNRSRPSSMYVSSNMDFLKDQEQQRKRPSLEIRRHSRQASQTRESEVEEGNIQDDMDYLRNTEHGDKSSRAQHKKRSSLGQIGSNAKSMFSGRFGDAFKRFEGNEKQGPLTPEARERDQEPELLSPIAGSEATPSRHSDHEEEEELPADVRRELERRKLLEEEDRVAAAAEEYRSRVAAQGTGNPGPTRASTIQKRVQSLLDDGRQSPAPRRTAEGYGRYTEQDAAPPRPAQVQVPLQSGFKPPIISQKPTGINPNSSNNPYPKTRQQPSESPVPRYTASPSVEQAPLQRVVPRPSAPPKPKALRTGGPAQWPPPQSPDLEKPLPAKPSSGLAALLAKDLEGVPDYPGTGENSSQAHGQPASNLIELSPTSPDDLESFSKRYPSLSGIEMVETEIGGERRMVRVKEI